MEWIGIASLTGIVALLFVVYIARKVMRQDPGTPEMVAISDAVHEGAMAFLKREYKAITIFAFIVAILLPIGLKGQGWRFSIATALSYLVGAACSLMAGYVGLSISRGRIPEPHRLQQKDLTKHSVLPSQGEQSWVSPLWA